MDTKHVILLILTYKGTDIYLLIGALISKFEVSMENSSDVMDKNL